MKVTQLSKALRDLANPVIAEHSRRFFKTGKGEYGEGDKFLGIRIPILRKQAKKYQDITLQEIQRLLKSSFHEERLCALLLLVRKFTQGDVVERTVIYQLYLHNTQYINNWDLVDSSAPSIVGVYLENRDNYPLYELAESDSLWERRIAIMATFHFIKNNQFDVTLDLAKQLISDEEDLIHKAVGWMLREIGKRDLGIEKAFLKAHYNKMPRTMLRYAIEKFSERERKKYLEGVV
ncbi:DNA alkylation repair protein [Thermodesulfobacteriota bacterium]